MHVVLHEVDAVQEYMQHIRYNHQFDCGKLWTGFAILEWNKSQINIKVYIEYTYYYH